jgi:nucleotide-binding universal stress UspA family protein
VVVGVDGSPGSRAALTHALIAAARRGADVDVVSSYGVELYYLGGAPFVVPDIAGLRDDHEARARTLVSEVQAELAVSFAPGIRDIGITVDVSSEPAARALLDRAEGAALLVVGSRGRGAVRSAVLGSVALHCVTHATCPVVVVHPTAEEPGASRLVVVGADGSPESRAALVAGVDEAARTGAEVEVVATYVPADYWTDLSSIAIPTAAQIHADLEERTRRLVADVLADRSDPGIAAPAVRIEILPGPAADVLVDRARAADLLVVGSRGRGAFRGLLLGSVALHCAMRAPCPVMVVHPLPGRSTAGSPSPAAEMADS